LPGDSRRKPLPVDTDMPINFGALMTIVSARFLRSPIGIELTKFGEYLPSNCAEGTFFIYHCTNVIDCLDHGRAEFSRSRSSGTILNIYKYAFHADRIPADCAFRLPDGNQYLTYLTGPMNTRLHGSSLTGVMSEAVRCV
jgi:hypothetical protein